jgi:dihydropteroate synthase
LRQLPKIRVGNSPILVGLSRKSMIGAITGRPVDERLAGSLVTAVLAAQNGANLIRVHDVVESADVLSILDAYGTL